jgi:hypothetical protein
MNFNDQWVTETDATPEPRPDARVSGRAVVIGMFTFGIAATSILWIYWTLHTGPFRPLQDALAVEFPGSVPRVDGGQRKMHKGTPKILRVVLRVDFDPVTGTRQGQQTLDRVEKLARHHIDLNAYDVLDVYLYHGVPERDLREKEFERTLKRSAH